MDLDKFLKEQAGEVEGFMQVHLSAWNSWIEKNTKSLTPHSKAFLKASKGGKKIRGILIYLGYKLAGGEEKSDIYDISSAYEIFHTSILAHDDIIDQSPVRRGIPSLYKALGGGHHGISGAICLGDLGFFLSTKIISESDFPSEVKIKALEHFSKTVMDTALGEILDVELPFIKGERKEKDVILIMSLKTAKYTVSAPLQLGAILAGADEHLIRVLKEFGENLGIAFQIQDDILGVFGEESELGKSNKSDIEEGKNTLLIIKALKNANSKQLRVLKKYYGKGKISTKALLKVRKIFEDSKALENSQKIALKYLSSAKKEIPGLTKDKDLSKILEQISDYLVERNK